MSTEETCNLQQSFACLIFITDSNCVNALYSTDEPDVSAPETPAWIFLCWTQAWSETLLFLCWDYPPPLGFPVKKEKGSVSRCLLHQTTNREEQRFTRFLNDLGAFGLGLHWRKPGPRQHFSRWSRLWCVERGARWKRSSSARSWLRCVSLQPWWDRTGRRKHFYYLELQPRCDVSETDAVKSGERLPTWKLPKQLPPGRLT